MFSEVILLHNAVSGAVVTACPAVITFVIVDDRVAARQVYGVHVAVLRAFSAGDAADLAVFHDRLPLQRVYAAYR